METLANRLNNLKDTEKEVYEIIKNAKVSEKTTELYINTLLNRDTRADMHGLIRQGCIEFNNGEYEPRYL